MNRREVLVATAAVVSTGCLGNGGSDNGSTAEPTDGAATATETDATATAEPTTAATETATTTAEPTATTTENETTGATTEARTETPAGTTTDGTTTSGTATNGTATGGSAANQSFTVRETGGEPGNEASVTVESGGSRIVVTGTITGENGCQTATLDSIRTDAGEVRIVVATERAADAGTMCTQALVGISYRATVTVERRPTSVTVIHRGAGGEETVSTAEPGG